MIDNLKLLYIFPENVHTVFSEYSKLFDVFNIAWK